MNDIASRLYPSSEPDAPATAAAPRANPLANPMASRLFSEEPKRFEDDGAPKEVKEERAADPARRLFSPQTAFATAVPDDALPGMDVPAVREVLADTGASTDDASQLVALCTALPMASEEDRAGWRAQSEALQLSKADVTLARAWVARDSRVFEFLDATGLGSHPRVVARVVELARAAKLR